LTSPEVFTHEGVDVAVGPELLLGPARAGERDGDPVARAIGMAKGKRRSWTVCHFGFLQPQDPERLEVVVEVVDVSP